MDEKKEREETVFCPVGSFFSDLDDVFGKKSQFFQHLTKSRIEFLKAIKSLLDDKIDVMEKRDATKGEKKATKIEVE